MKGLLHRLAARAAGTALPVRSDVRLPFGAGGWEEAVPAQAEAAAPAAVASLLAQAPLAHADPASAAPAPIADLRTAPSPVLAARAAPVALDEHQPPGRRAPVETTETSRRDRLPPRLLGEGLDPRSSIDAPTQQADAQTRLEPGAIAALPPSPAPPAAPAARAAASSRPEAAGPARLMPAATPRPTPAATMPVAGQSAWSAYSTARSPARAAKAEEPTEVHVHIGRIDVTAVHEPAAPRRRPAGAPAPMSLDTYLARRSRP